MRSVRLSSTSTAVLQRRRSFRRSLQKLKGDIFPLLRARAYNCSVYRVSNVHMSMIVTASTFAAKMYNAIGPTVDLTEGLYAYCT